MHPDVCGCCHAPGSRALLDPWLGLGLLAAASLVAGDISAAPTIRADPASMRSDGSRRLAGQLAQPVEISGVEIDHHTAVAGGPAWVNTADGAATEAAPTAARVPHATAAGTGQSDLAVIGAKLRDRQERSRTLANAPVGVGLRTAHSVHHRHGGQALHPPNVRRNREASCREGTAWGPFRFLGRSPVSAGTAQAGRGC